MPSPRFIVTTTVLVLLTYGLARAAPATRPALGELPALQRLQNAVAGLDLTADQKKQVDALQQEVAETVRSMAPQLKDASPEDRRKQLREALGDVREKFLSILTPEQKRTLAEDREGRQVPGRKPLADLKADGKADKNADKGGDKKAEKGGETPVVQRVRDALDTVGLTPEQKTKTDAILDDAAVQARQLRQDAAGNRQAARQKAVAVIRDIHDKLFAVLTPEQQTKLVDAMPRLGNAGGRRGRAADPPATKPSPAQTPDPAPAKAAAASSDGAPVTPAPAVLVVGSPAPDFSLARVGGGSPVTLKTFAGKPLVLVFGSLSSPAFRDRLPRLEAVRNKYRGRAVVLVAYTREAHPADGWQVDRNRADKVEVSQPTTPAERLALATRLRGLSKTPLDIAVDGVDDKTAGAYALGGDGAAVISAYGTVVGTQQYCDPSGLPRLIDAAIVAKD